MAPPAPSNPLSATAEWSWEDTAGSWIPYEREISKQIEAARAVGDKEVIIIVDLVIEGSRSSAYRIEFSTMRQINLSDPKKRRSVRRVEVPPTARVDSPELTAARAAAIAAGVEIKKNGTRKGYHLTNEGFATSIIRSSSFTPSKSGSMGPFIYFTNKPEDCVGKAQAAKDLNDGALLAVQADLGYSIVTSSRTPPPSVSAFLGIISWNELTADKLRKAGCQSVYGQTAPGWFSRDEWAVPLSTQLSGIRLSAYHKKAAPVAGQPAQLVPVPFWQWPGWVNNLAHATNVSVDHMAVDSPWSASGKDSPAGEKYGVRVNAAGRPVHSDGKFMSYKEAMSRGWGGGGATKLAVDISDAFTTPAKPAAKHADTGTGGGNAWNDFQSAHKGEGWSREQMSREYAKVKAKESPRTPEKKPAATAASSPHTGGGTRVSSSWNEHQKAMGGQGMSREEIRASYSSPAAPAAPSPRSTPSSGGGSGASRPTSGSSNSWNDHQKAMGGLGMSRAEIRASYSAPTPSYSSPSRSSSYSGGGSSSSYSSSSYSGGGGGGGGGSRTYSSSGSCNGATIHTGSRGGSYVFTSGGNKRYI